MTERDEDSDELQELPLQQLQQLYNELNANLQVLLSSFGKVRQISESLSLILSDVKSLSEDKRRQKDALIPLTSMLYVDAKIGDVNRYIIDVGGGFYIEKDYEGTCKYYERRINYIEKDTAELSKCIEIRKARIARITSVLRSKIEQDGSKVAVIL